MEENETENGMEGYKEVRGGDVVVFEKDGDRAEGELVDVRPNVGMHNSTMYDLQSGGKLLSIWGSTVLDGKMRRVRKADPGRKGDWVVIVFKGIVPKTKEHNEYKDFQVFVKEPENKGDV